MDLSKIILILFITLNTLLSGCSTDVLSKESDKEDIIDIQKVNFKTFKNSDNIIELIRDEKYYFYPQSFQQNNVNFTEYTQYIEKKLNILGFNKLKASVSNKTYALLINSGYSEKTTQLEDIPTFWNLKNKTINTQNIDITGNYFIIRIYDIAPLVRDSSANLIYFKAINSCDEPSKYEDLTYCLIDKLFNEFE